MRQPAGGFHEFFRSGAAGPFEQVENLGGLAAIAGNFGLGNLGVGCGPWARSWAAWPCGPTRAQRWRDVALRDVMAQCTYCKTETFLYYCGAPVCIQCAEGREAEAKSPKTEQEIRLVLVNRLVEATARVSAANETFSAVMSQVPSGLPPPDRTQRYDVAVGKITPRISTNPRVIQTSRSSLSTRILAAAHRHRGESAQRQTE
jgi:hypothetical protein